MQIRESKVFKPDIKIPAKSFRPQVITKGWKIKPLIYEGKESVACPHFGLYVANTEGKEEAHYSEGDKEGDPVFPTF